MTPPLYDLDRLRSALVSWGTDRERIEHHARIDSTNTRALVLAAAADLPLPYLVLADRQTAGRGRGGNPWWSAPGGIAFSLVLETSAARISPAQWPQLSLVAGLAVCEALEPLVPSSALQVKWPNDVYLAGRKVCGILIESPASPPGRLVIGVGVNVNNSFADAPPELRDTAIAACDVNGRPLDLTGVLLALLEQLQERWNQLAMDGFASMIESWRSRCFLSDKTVHLQAGEETAVGRCLGIAEDGALILQTETGRHHYHAGTIIDWE